LFINRRIKMNTLYYDCFSGISGDMNLGAMIDLGVDKDYLIQELSKLKLHEEFELKITRDSRKGISGTKVDVVLKHEHDHDEEHNREESQCHPHGDNDHCQAEEHPHDHNHGEGHHHNMEGHQHEHEHLHKHSHKENHHHEHRNFKDIESLINSSELSDEVKRLSLNIFMRVAIAEAKVHGKAIEEVHFHEVGATDSIVDIVGAAICAEYLKVDRVMCSSVELGSGFVRCAHGLIPVPAPATVEILRGIPVKAGVVPKETTTPTGAAILAELVDEFTDKKNFIIDKIGYGIGNRDTEIPNVLRVFLADVK
jgi:pyridinium-3,5-bisthiocarboxylic acid mononucleotide nickel chelatase